MHDNLRKTNKSVRVFGGLKVVIEKRITQFLNSNIAKPAKHDYVRLAYNLNCL